MIAMTATIYCGKDGGEEGGRGSDGEKSVYLIFFHLRRISVAFERNLNGILTSFMSVVDDI